MAERVKKAKELYKAQSDFKQGCSQFVCEVLGISWKSANDLMGSNPTSTTFKAGDVVGWKGASHGHVAIYIGESGMTYLDVPGEGKKPRALTSYGTQKVVKSAAY